MKFKELDNVGKAIAVKEYINGWKETHPNDIMSYKTALDCCMDLNNDIEYIKQGSLVEEIKMS